MRLAGKIAVITGSGRGLGRAMALAYAREGASVVVAARSADEIAETVWLIEESGHKAYAIQTDVRDAAQVDTLASQTISHFGGVHIVVNSAGIGLRMPFQETSEAMWDSVVDTLLKGTFLVNRTFLSYLIEQKQGEIINIGAPLDLIAVPGFAIYATAKYAVEGMTRVMAKELRRYGINVNILHPGGFANTRMVRETVPEATRGLLDPEQITEAAIGLAAQGPRGKTGQVINARQWNRAD